MSSRGGLGSWSRAVVGGALAILLATVLFGQEVGPTLRVMSFNVRLGVADDGDDSWEHRKLLVARTIRDFDPDLLGTQEAWPFQSRFILQELGDLEYVGWPRRPGDGEECAILYRKSRFEKTDEGQFWLSETPEVAASKSWDSSLPRIVTWVALRDKSGSGRELVFLNTHFDHRGAGARLESARLLRRHLAGLSRPWVLTGDFNCGEGSPPYEALVGEGEGLVVVDSYRAIRPRRQEGEGTFNGFEGRRGGERIDWLLVPPTFQVVGAAIDRTEAGGRFPSDHFPVTAVLRYSDP